MRMKERREKDYIRLSKGLVREKGMRTRTRGTERDMKWDIWEVLKVTKR